MCVSAPSIPLPDAKDKKRKKTRADGDGAPSDGRKRGTNQVSNGGCSDRKRERLNPKLEMRSEA
jgi:hypothetical protein